MYTDSQISDMNKTCRDSGAVGATSRAWKHATTFLANAPRGLRVLDFGAGRALRHVKAMRAQYPHLSIEGSEIGANNTSAHIQLLKHHNSTFDVVVVSNVLNVQPSRAAVAVTLARALQLVRVGGVVVANVAASPNRCGIDAADVQVMAHRMGHYAAVKNHVATIVREA